MQTITVTELIKPKMPKIFSLFIPATNMEYNPNPQAINVGSTHITIGSVGGCDPGKAGDR
jgi:hypothetical protein